MWKWKNVLKVLGVVVLVGAAVGLALKAKIDADTAECQTLLAAANSDIADVRANPTGASVFCSAAKQSIKLVEDICPEFTVVPYSGLIPPCT